MIMANHRAHAHHRPIRFLSIAWLITLAALVAFLWCAYDSYRRFARTAQQNLRIQELRGQIIRLDEVLTMSARMCALSPAAATAVTANIRLAACLRSRRRSQITRCTSARVRLADAVIDQMIVTPPIELSALLPHSITQENGRASTGVGQRANRAITSRSACKSQRQSPVHKDPNSIILSGGKFTEKQNLTSYA
jgi:hypothetical protein